MTAEQPTILASCGGLDPGGWTDVVYGPLILHGIELAAVTGRAPRVAHINTAGGDPRILEGQEIEAARLVGAEASHLRLFPHPNVESLRDYLLSRDLVWVNGGSVVNLLAVWRAHGLGEALREAWLSGVVLAGGSAGAICWHTGGTTTSFGPEPRPVEDGLGFVPYSLGVHYDSDARRRPAHERAVAAGVIDEGYALDEGVGLVYRGVGDRLELAEIVAERAGQHAYRLERARVAQQRSPVEPSPVERSPVERSPVERSPVEPSAVTETVLEPRVL
jgi:peptidase E